MKQKVRRELFEWVAIITVLGSIYLLGWHTEILGKIQQALLSTQLIEADENENPKPANYRFDLESLSGKPYTLSQDQGEVIFLNFWATWCPPCIAELPTIQKLYSERNEEIVFVLVSLDKDPEKVMRFMDRKGYTLPVFFPTSPVPKSFPIDVVPSTFVIDRNGLIQVHHEGMANYNTKDFKQLLTKLSEAKQAL